MSAWFGDVIGDARQSFQRMRGFEVLAEGGIRSQATIDDRLLAIDVDEPLE